jgi:PRTRC genetic system protein A
MNIPVGYLVNSKDGLQGDDGIIYNYIFAVNGVFLHCHNELLDATIKISEAQIRGLVYLERKFELKKGKIPSSFLDMALSVAFANPGREAYLAVAWEDGYHLKIPDQTGEPGSVKYAVMSNTIMDIHTHGALPPFFSSDDDADEQGFRLSLVIGSLLAEREEILVRIGIYGYYADLEIGEVFK